MAGFKAPPPRRRIPGKGQLVWGTLEEVARIERAAKDRKKAESVRDAPIIRPAGTGRAAPAVVPKPRPQPARTASVPVVSAPSAPVVTASPPDRSGKRVVGGITYQSLKSDVKLAKGQVLRFAKDRGYYAGTPVPKRTPSTATAAELAMSPAEQIVQAALAPMYAQLDAAKREQGIQDTARQDALSGFTKEIIDYLQGGAGDVGSDYDRAIQQTDQLAQTAATGLINANPNPQTQADLAAINAPAAQQAAVAAQNQQVFGGGGATLYKTEGGIPGSALAASKAAQQAYQRGLPSIFAAEGQNALKALLFQSAGDARALADKRAEVQSKRPGLLLEAESALADLAFKRKADLRNDLLAESVTGNRLFDQQATTVRLDQAQQNISLRQAALLSSLYGVDAAGNLTLDGRRVAQAEAKNQKASKGIPASKYAQLKKDALKQANIFYEGAEDAKGNVTAVPVTYHVALRRLMEGYSIKLVDAQNILNTFWQPGEDGRPFITFQQRSLLLGKGVSRAKINAAMYDGQLAQALLGRL